VTGQEESSKATKTAETTAAAGDDKFLAKIRNEVKSSKQTQIELNYNFRQNSCLKCYILPSLR